MKKLKTILQSKYLFKIILVICIIYASIIINFYPRKSKYKENTKEFIGITTSYKTDGDHLTLELKGKEKIIVHYYFKEKKEKEVFLQKIELGSKLKIIGTLNKPTNATIPNGFNYKKYLYNEGIFYLLSASNIDILKNNTSIFYKIKNTLTKRIDKVDSTGYLRTFILGDKTMLSSETMSEYQENGISHLFSISGMHVSFIVGFLIIILSKLTYNNKLKYSIIIMFLIFYLYLTNCSASIIRTTIMFILFTINRLYNLKIKPIDLLLLVLSIVLIINPYLIFNVGFQFSYIISTSIILSKKNINKYKKKYQQSLYISYLSFIISLPICIYHFQSVNFLSIIFNLIMIPIVSTIIFPLTFIILIVPNLYPLYSVLIKCLEYLNSLFYQIDIFKVIFSKPSIYIIIIYYILIILSLYRKKYISILLILLIIHKSYPYLNNNFTLSIIDVEQGDSILISFPHNKGNVLIDTGGKTTYQKEKWATNKKKSSIAHSKIIPYLHSIGITKLDYLIFTHGDFDHIGEATNLVNNFKVSKVIFNKGEYNTLEENLIDLLRVKNIKYYHSINKIKIDNYTLYFLNTRIYDNENDNSSVIYFKINKYKFLLMGDASIKKEKDIINNYNIEKIDFLKVGHHGSDTSSSIEFINKIKPKYSLISVGKNNRYGHPKNSVLDILKMSNIYRTDTMGSVIIKINNKRYKINIYEP